MAAGEHDAEELPPQGLILPLDVIPSAPQSAFSQRTAGAGHASIKPRSKTYSPERQHDYVRLILTCGLLLILGYLVVFATVESASYPAHWTQTKEMLQIILPALTGIIGTVIGFYFGTAAVNGNQPPTDDGL